MMTSEDPLEPYPSEPFSDAERVIQALANYWDHTQEMTPSEISSLHNLAKDLRLRMNRKIAVLLSSDSVEKSPDAKQEEEDKDTYLLARCLHPLNLAVYWEGPFDETEGVLPFSMEPHRTAMMTFIDVSRELEERVKGWFERDYGYEPR